MFGSILYNLWGSLIAFSITFILMYSDSISPTRILIASFSMALLVFLVMFAIRYVIAYIVYTPDDKIFESFIKQNESVNEESVETGQSNVEMQQIDPTSTVEFQDEQPEEIANVVRTMMSGQ